MGYFRYFGVLFFLYYCLWLIINIKGLWNFIILLLIYLYLYVILFVKDERYIYDIFYGKNWLLINVRVKCLYMFVYYELNLYWSLFIY